MRSNISFLVSSGVRLFVAMIFITSCNYGKERSPIDAFYVLSCFPKRVSELHNLPCTVVTGRDIGEYRAQGTDFPAVQRT